MLGFKLSFDSVTLHTLGLQTAVIAMVRGFTKPSTATERRYEMETICRAISV